MSEELMTFKEIMQNPTGRGTGMVAARYSIIDNLNMRSETLLAKKDIQFRVFSDDEAFVVQFKVPSEQEEYKIEYDVVIRFIPTNAESRSLSGYQVQLFSNSPAFSFTYAYVINERDWLVPELSGKFERQFTSTPPRERNPEEIYGFEKSIYFSLFLLRHRNVTFLSQLERLVYGKVDWALLLREIPSAQEKLSEYEKEKERVNRLLRAKRAKDKAAKAEEEKKRQRDIRSPARVDSKSVRLKTTKAVPRSKKVKSVKRK